MSKLTLENVTAELVRSLECYWVAPEVYSVEDMTVIPGQHMEDEERITATCHYTKGSEHVRQQVEFYWDVFDSAVYVDSPV